MRVLHIADVHLGLLRFSRAGEWYEHTERVLRQFTAYARDREADVAIVAGDFFDSRQPNPRALAAAARFVRDLPCPLILTPGNHDGPAQIGDLTSHTLGWLDALELPNVYVTLRPHVLRVGGAVFVAFPYPHKRSFDVARADLDPQARHEYAATQLEAAIEAKHAEAVELAAGLPVIFVGHLTAVGATVGSERAMRLEDDLSVGSPVLDRFDYAALGHIHKQQRIGQRAYYAGSPEYVDFGEAGQPKGFLLAEVQRGEPPVVEVLDSGARRMVSLTDVWPDDAPSVEGAIVRAEFTTGDVSRTQRRQVTEDLYAAGASYVEVMVRAPEARVAAERALPVDADPAEAVRRYLAANGHAEQPYLDAARELMSAS